MHRSGLSFGCELVVDALRLFQRGAHDVCARHAPRRASRNIPFILATDDVLQRPMGWSKVDAPLNVLAMEVTDMMFRSAGRLKAAAPANMLAVEVTDAVLHLPMGWSKAAAPENISAMFDAPTTFHWLKSEFNIVWLVPGARTCPCWR